MARPLARGRNPFDETGVQRGADGIARDLERPPSLVPGQRDRLDADSQETPRGARAKLTMRATSAL